MCLAIANVLATSYCNLAAPLVCLDLLGHVELIIFQGTMSREVFEARDSGRRPIQRQILHQFLLRSGLAPRPERCQRMAARCCREETWRVIAKFARY